MRGVRARHRLTCQWSQASQREVSGREIRNANASDKKQAVVFGGRLGAGERGGSVPDEEKVDERRVERRREEERSGRKTRRQNDRYMDW